MYVISAPTIKSSGISGELYLSEPLDACSPLINKIHPSSSLVFALVARNNCSFEEKVRRAQKAGFEAVIVYDSDDSGPLVKSNDRLTYRSFLFSDYFH